MCEITARDCMTTRLVTLSPEMDVLKAVELLLKNRISGAPVVDALGNYLGVFSEKCSMQVLLDAAYEQLPSNEVRMFMNTDAMTIESDTQLLSMAQVFLLTNYRRLPVLEDGVLIGQVSRRDVMREALGELRKQGVTQDTGSTLLYLSAVVERSDAPLV
ncbi:CBS domain-containing protein [Bythopirellula polymerisocia]|uniref:CBS domain protein n=1 Tax=Bythopirellula polymerisocia TaxID=2528003 RepID=A0A5C6CQI6_9BACT|nr:CBS domain-containing protein [Bythopirellula polymerisocia]TWU25701.1 CBS domain protein [Bythopirellula polymerisocia]